jgi:hypothetical protein
LFVYVQDLITKNTVALASAVDFFKWFEDVGHRNENIFLAFNLVFNVLHPLFLFRAGIRQCNDEASYDSFFCYFIVLCFILRLKLTEHVIFSYF